MLQVGFAALLAHHIVPIDRCPILSPGLAGAIETAWDIAEELKGEAKPLDIQVTATETGLDVDVRGSGPLSPQRSWSTSSIWPKTEICQFLEPFLKDYLGRAYR